MPLKGLLLLKIVVALEELHLPKAVVVLLEELHLPKAVVVLLEELHLPEAAVAPEEQHRNRHRGSSFNCWMQDHVLLHTYLNY